MSKIASSPWIAIVAAGSSRTPLHLARRTRTIWPCWHVPALPGLLAALPAPPRSGCPQLQPSAATGRRWLAIRSDATALRLASVFLYGLLLAAWLIVAARTARGDATGRLFLPAAATAARPA